ncbi:hypothetical protein [Streptomyces sp. NPDC056628]|uniref:hypothetical protein n=1 Tax=Streptomyces sp. NPDC056628 TaxID=3345882 RepID=UPI0036885096
MINALFGGVMGTSGRGGEGRKYALSSDEDISDFWGFVHEADGLFTPLPDEESDHLLVPLAEIESL